MLTPPSCAAQLAHPACAGPVTDSERRSQRLLSRHMAKPGAAMCGSSSVREQAAARDERLRGRG